MAREGLSRGDLLLLGAVLSAAGAGISAYLTWAKIASSISAVCNVNAFVNCEVVLVSPYSSFLGIPTATVGLGGFLILLSLFLLGFRGRERIGPLSVDTWVLGFAALGALAGLGLTFIEVFVIQAICLFCVAGFVLDLAVLGTAYLLRRKSNASA